MLDANPTQAHGLVRVKDNGKYYSKKTLRVS